MISVRIRRRSANRWAAATLAIAAIALLVVVPSARGDDKRAESAAILERIRMLEDLRAAGGTPFVLEAQILATKGKSQTRGTYSLTWISANRWHEEVRLPDFARIRDGVDGGYRQTRTLDFQPEAIFEIDKMLDIAARTRLSQRESVTKAKTRRVGSLDLSCVEIRFESISSRELCVDPAEGVLVQAVEHDEKIDYSGAISVGTMQFPAHIRLSDDSDFALEVDVDNLHAFSGDANSLPSPQLSAEFWGTCEDEKPVEASQQVYPRFPLGPASSNPRSGVVLLYARVEPNGKLSRLRVLSQPTPDYGRAAMDAVSKWKFKPATCGGTAVPFEFMVVSKFTVYQ